MKTLEQETTEREEVVKTVTEVMAFGKDGMDVCWKTWQQHKDSDSDSDSESSAAGNNDSGDQTTSEDDSNSNNNNNSNNKPKALVALCLLRSVHCSAVFQDIQYLCNHSVEEEEEEAVGDAPSGKELEEYVITSSRMFYDLSSGCRDTTSDWIRQQLDEIADMVKARFPPEDLTTPEKLDILNTVFFDELNFGGNTDNYYDFQNSLLHVALQLRTGIPMTLAVIYKCISRRIGLQVEIIGLPGHIVIGLPELNAYVDVFRRGRRLLTVADCERIVNTYGHHMVPEYIQPLTPAQVFRRILNNFGNCLAQAFPPETSKRMAVEAMRAVLINPSDDQINDCRRWFSQILWGSHSTAILQEMSRW
jgi:regulator of sirC expression with transglutaminase-like and TPR domain